MHLPTGRTESDRAAASTSRAARAAALAGLLMAGIAFAASPPRFTPAASVQAGQGGAPTELRVTLGTDTDAGACGTATTLEVTRLDPVNICYTMSNHSEATLTYQTLADDVVGTLLSAVPLTLAPGESAQYNRIITARESQSPTTQWTAYDAHPGYAFADNAAAADILFKDGFDGGSGGQVEYDFIDITQTGTPLDMLGDGFPAAIDIGFPFTYYGQTSTNVLASLNGGLLFGVTEGFLPGESMPLPDASLGAAILPYWTTIYYPQPEDGNEYFATLGEAPNRRFVLEWVNVPILVGGIHEDGATFEVVLFEGSNEILFQYADTNVGDPARDDGIGSTIGLNPPPGVEAAVQYSYHTASVEGGRAILFSPSNPLTYTASAQATIDVGVPQIVVSPGSFDKTVAAGGSTTDTLSIGNIGNRDLRWKLAAYASRAHFPPVSRFTLPFGDPSATSALPAPAHAAHGTAARGGIFPMRGGVPAFAIDANTSTVYSLDAASPAELVPVGDAGDWILAAGDFVDEDFGRLYAIDWYTWKLMTVDTATAATEVIGVADLGSDAAWNWTGLAWDASTGTLYGVGYKPFREGGGETYLYSVDPVTAATTTIGVIGGDGIGDAENGSLVIDIAFDADGNMYGIELVGDDFIAIDKADGAASVIASLGFDANYGQGIDLDDYTNTFYYAAYNDDTDQSEMYTIEPSTGAISPVAPIGADPANSNVGAFAVARLGGVCAYPNDVPWLAFDLPEGTTVPDAQDEVTVTFDASTLEAGVHSGYLCISSNDMTQRRYPVPVTLTVE